MLILKQNSANSVPTPPAGKGTIFLDDSDTLSVKTADGNVETFPTVAASNTQVIFIDGTSLSGNANFVYNKNTDTLTLSGSLATGNVKTDNLLYANGVPWDLSDPGGNNTEIQFNDDESFGGSAAFTFNKSSNAVSMGGALTVTGNASAGALSVTGNANVGNLGTAGLIVATGNITGGNLVTTGTGSVGELAVSGNAVITGNLAVNGNVTYVNVDTLQVEDPIIELGGGPNGAPLTSNDGKDRGTLLHYFTTSAIDAFMGWDSSNSEFGFGSSVSIVNDVITFNTLGNLRASTLLANVNGATALFSGNANANNFNAAGAFYGNAAGLTNIPSGNISGQVANALVAGTVYTSAQPNITSVGTLTSLSVTGNVSAGGLLTNNLYYANGSPWDLQLPGGSNTQIQFNDDDQFGGSSAFVFNKTSNLVTLQGGLYVNANNAVRVGPTANLISYPNVQFVSSFGTSGVTSPLGAGIVGEGTGVSGTPGLDVVGVAGVGVVNGAGRASGVIGSATVTETTDTGAAVGVRGISVMSHTGGYNIGLLGNAANGGLGSYAFYIQQGGIGSIEGNVVWDLFDDSSAALAFNSSGKANILLISSDDGAEGVSMSGTLNVTGNSNVSNLGASGLITATGNVSGGNLTTGGVVAATGNVSGGNLTTAGALSVTGNANVGNIGTNGLVITGTVLGNLNPSANITYDLGSDSLRWRDLYLSGNTLKLGTQSFSSNATSVVFSGVLTGNAAGLAALNASNLSSGTVDAARLSGNYTINVIGWANTVADNAQPNITSVGTLTGLGVNGNITAANITANTGVFTGNAAGLTNIPGGNISGQVANALVAGTVYTNAQPNITSVGTLTSLGVTGNVTAGNVAGGNLVSANFLTGTLTTAAQPNITSVGTLTGLGVNGTVTAVAFTANTGVFTGNGSGLSQLAGGNVTGQVGNALVAGTVYTNAQPNITSVGTLTGLDVNGNITAANITANTGVFTGNANGLSSLQAGNLTGTVAQARLANSTLTLGNTTLTLGATTTTVAGLSSVTSTTFVGALTGAATTAGTVTTAAQPNVTSVGTLSSLSVSGNVAAGNLNTTGVLSVTGTGVSSIAGNLDMTSNNIVNLATPVNASDAATKQYVDDVAQGLHTHDSCNAATSSTLAVSSGGTVTYNNGSSGVGATLTTTGSYTTIDGVTLSNGMRILVKDEANAAHNGIYDRTSSTVLTRSTDFDTPVEMAGGDFTFVTAGTLYDNTGWVMTDTVTTVGTTNVNWTQFSGAGTFTAGTGLTLTGTVFSVNASQTQITSVGTLSSLGVSGNITAANITANTGVFTGNGSGLSQLAGGNVTGQVANALVAGTVYTAAQPNITSVGTLTSLSVTGNVSAGNVSGTLLTGTLATAAQPNVTSLGTLTSLGVNGTVTAVAFTANTGVFTGNGSGLSAIAGANVTGTVSSATTAGTVTTAAQPNITSTGTLTGLGVNGNITAANITANTGVFSGNANGISSVQAGNIVGTTLSSTVVTSSLTTVGTVGSGTWNSAIGSSATFAAGLSGANLATLNASNISSGTLAQARLANASVTLGSTALTLGSTVTTVAGLSSVTSTTFVGALTGAATTAGTVTTAAQPNITSVGTLTGLTVSSTISGSVSGTAATVTTAAQPNITSVGTLTGLTVSGNLVCSAFFDASVNASVSAAGTVQGNATVIASEINVVSTVASGAGVVFPTPAAGIRITLINTSANALLVYPASGGAINSLATNAAYSLPASGRLEFVATSTTQWYTMGAAYS